MYANMRSMLVLCIPMLFLSRADASVNRDVSPVQKVVKLLSELKMKIERDGAEEKKLFDAFMVWCKDGGKEKEFEIKTSKAEIEDLEATIGKAASNIQVASDKITDLGSALAANDADLKAATTIREKAHEEFVVLEKDMVDTLDTLERAINILSRKLHGSALMQAKVDSTDVKHLISTLSAIIDAAALSLHDRTKLLGLVQSSADEDDAAYGAPAAEAYKSHSEGIIDVLEDLKQKAATELESARAQETNDRHAYEMLKQSLTDQMKADESDLSSSKAMKHEATETLAGAKGSLEQEKKALANAESVLKSMEGDCAQKKEDNEMSVAKRAEELKAIDEAKKVLVAHMEGAAKITYGESFLQIIAVNDLHSSVGSHLQTHADLANFEVVNLLRKLAREQKSVLLQQLAARISTAIKNSATSGEDPFAKVKAMISEMIEKLLKDAGEEAQHKAYCDKEMGETQQKIDELNYDIEKLSTKIDKARATSVTLKDEVAQLQSALAKIAKAMAEADELRAQELKIYNENKVDMEKGLQGVRMAMKILRDYYADEPEAASLLQQPESPGVHSKASDSAGGIISMLEVVESDLSKTLATIEMNEETASTAYEKGKMENKMDKMMKEQDVKYKTKEAASLDKEVAELSSDLDSAQSELDAVLDSKKNIHAMCDTKPETYEERVARREAEIEGLKEALKILEGETMFLQSHSRPLRLRGHLAVGHPHIQQ